MTRLKATKGFTLIELLVTIVIIGILAAVAMLAYNHQTAKADKSAGIQTLTLAAQAAESSTDTGDYSGLTDQTLADQGYKGAAVVTVATQNGYCLDLTTPKGVALHYSSDDGVASEGSCVAAP